MARPCCVRAPDESLYHLPSVCSTKFRDSCDLPSVLVDDSERTPCQRATADHARTRDLRCSPGILGRFRSPQPCCHRGARGARSFSGWWSCLKRSTAANWPSSDLPLGRPPGGASSPSVLLFANYRRHGHVQPTAPVHGTTSPRWTWSTTTASSPGLPRHYPLIPVSQTGDVQLQQ